MNASPEDSVSSAGFTTGPKPGVEFGAETDVSPGVLKGMGGNGCGCCGIGGDVSGIACGATIGGRLLLS